MASLLNFLALESEFPYILIFVALPFFPTNVQVVLSLDVEVFKSIFLYAKHWSLVRNKFYWGASMSFI